jgi:hypothetical protein
VASVRHAAVERVEHDGRSLNLALGPSQRFRIGAFGHHDIRKSVVAPAPAVLDIKRASQAVDVRLEPLHQTPTRWFRPPTAARQTRAPMPRRPTRWNNPFAKRPGTTRRVCRSIGSVPTKLAGLAHR